MAAQGRKIVNVLRARYTDKNYIDRGSGWVSESWAPFLKLEPNADRAPIALCGARMDTS